MSTGRQDPSFDDLYRLIIGRLGNLEGASVIQDIEQAIERGVLTTSPKEFGKSAGAVRPMDDQERLSVALEFLITACQPPLMIESALGNLQCDQIQWAQDERTREQAGNFQRMSQDDIAELQARLSDLRSIIDQLAIKMPEMM